MKKLTLFLAVAFTYITLTSESGCDAVKNDSPIESASGVNKASVTVKTDLNGNTVEQNNIIGRYAEDNKPGAIKHLYILSAYSGQVLIYSTVKGKVTSSGKRLNPYTVAAGYAGTGSGYGTAYGIDYRGDKTGEVLQDDGTYGGSVEYIYWWDSKNIYHQQYVTGGMILHISNQPISVKSVVINMEESTKTN